MPSTDAGHGTARPGTRGDPACIRWIPRLRPTSRLTALERRPSLTDMQRNRTPRAVLSLLLGVLVLGQAVLTPLLERSEGGRRSVLESRHVAGSCVVGHDHTLCTQVGANRALSTDVVRLRLPVVALSVSTRIEAPRLASASRDPGHRPRAPPIA